MMVRRFKRKSKGNSLDRIEKNSRQKENSSIIFLLNKIILVSGFLFLRFQNNYYSDYIAVIF